MSTATTTSPAPFASIQIDPGEFILESGLLDKWSREGVDCSIRSAMRNAGFQCRRLRRIPEHRLIIVDGDLLRAEEFEPSRRIKARVLRSFRATGLQVRPEFYCLRGTQSKLIVSVGIFEKSA